MRKKDTWLFFFAALGAVAALVKILEYFEITPDKWSNAMNMPPAPLLWGIGFFVLSFGLSIVGLHRVKVGEKQNSHSHAKEVEALRKEIQHHLSAASDREGRLNECRSQVLKLEAQLAAKPEIVKEHWNPPFHTDKSGWRLESATFGVDGMKPNDVTAIVDKQIKAGKVIGPAWQDYNNGRAVREHSTHFLTVTISGTIGESGSPLSTPVDFFSEHQPSGLLAIAKKELKNTQEEIADLKRRLLDNGPKVQLSYVGVIRGVKTLFVKPDRGISNFGVEPIETPTHSLWMEPSLIEVPTEGEALRFRFKRKLPRTDGSPEHQTFEGFDEVFDAMCSLDNAFKAEIPLRVSFWERHNEYKEEWSIGWSRILSGSPKWSPALKPVRLSYVWIDHYAAARDTSDNKPTIS